MSKDSTGPYTYSSKDGMLRIGGPGILSPLSTDYRSIERTMIEVNRLNAAYRAGQASPAAIPVLSDEEIERIADQHDGSRARNSDGTTYMHSPWGNGMKYALRYANTRAVTVEQIMEVVDKWRVDNVCKASRPLWRDDVKDVLRDRLTKLFNGG